MIISASTRTDIPAFYSEWFYNRIKEGYVYVRNPYNAHQVSKYLLLPDIVDTIVFWTKNPKPMMERLEEIMEFHPYFFVTITPYGKEIEAFVPEMEQVLADTLSLANRLERDSVCVRYDPILINNTYTVAYHKETFARLAERMQGRINDCVISFIDIYEKTKRNFAGVRSMTQEEMLEIASSFGEIGKRYGIRIKTCAEAVDLTKYGIYNSGCISKDMMERHLGFTVKACSHAANRSNCMCIENKDIGAYNTCLHGCTYCYANYDEKTVRQNVRLHDKSSPFLVGGPRPEDVITQAKQESILDGQLRFDFLS